MKEKTNKSIIISVAVAIHILLITCFIIQGCGTLSPMKAREPSVREPELGKVPMPESEPVKEEIKIPTAPPVIEEKEPLPVTTTKYVVRSGDTLLKIAKRYNLKLAEIVALNKIKAPNKIREGQVLLLPGDIKVEPPPAKRPSTSYKKTSKPSAEVTLPVGDEEEYVVKPGDSLSVIAKEHGTTVKALKQLNSLTTDKIIVGQKLKISGSTTERKEEITTKSEAVQPLQPPVSPENIEQGVAPQPLVRSPDVSKSVAPSSAERGGGIGYVTIHTVAPGETLESIARAWLVDKNAIKEANNLTNDIVSPGQVLKIPLTK